MNYDTSYVKSYRDQLIIRGYGITKYNRLTIRDVATDNRINFDPNSNVNFGAGFNYKWLGFNAAFNFPFINNDDEKLGKTRFIDLQADIYGRKYLINVLFQDYKGFRITDNKMYLPQIAARDTIFLKRDDIHTQAIGVNGYYNLNSRKFSYFSPFIQNEWQKRSAGSFFVGGYLTALEVKTDSTLLFADYQSQFESNVDIQRGKFSTIGVSGGYAHTFVMYKKFFVTLSAAGGLGAEHSEIKSAENTPVISRESSINFSTFTRGAMGYNTDKLHIGLSFSSNINTYREKKTTDVIYQFGNVRLYLVKRLNIKKDNST
ncbi:DUF4421 domain-containing protein [Chondrinema litorale]|uniref:DUF4421 domain-containing protein n=1 Tax=Chondrinema litorale TaxID=2994555 RepID=UPI0025426BF8|nr:DUF4421 domain-containing protein [Chondrinema litorale]UZR94050.1 DUF4421 domain-containing protein [Chondrinema litorale]